MVAGCHAWEVANLEFGLAEGTVLDLFETWTFLSLRKPGIGSEESQDIPGIAAGEIKDKLGMSTQT